MNQKIYQTTIVSTFSEKYGITVDPEEIKKVSVLLADTLTLHITILQTAVRSNLKYAAISIACIALCLIIFDDWIWRLFGLSSVGFFFLLMVLPNTVVSYLKKTSSDLQEIGSLGLGVVKNVVVQLRERIDEDRKKYFIAGEDGDDGDEDFKSKVNEFVATIPSPIEMIQFAMFAYFSPALSIAITKKIPNKWIQGSLQKFLNGIVDKLAETITSLIPESSLEMHSKILNNVLGRVSVEPMTSSKILSPLGSTLELAINNIFDPLIKFLDDCVKLIDEKLAAVFKFALSPFVAVRFVLLTIAAAPAAILTFIYLCRL